MGNNRQILLFQELKTIEMVFGSIVLITSVNKFEDAANDNDDNEDEDVDDLEDHPIDGLVTGACCEGAVIVEVLVHQNLLFNLLDLRHFFKYIRRLESHLQFCVNGIGKIKRLDTWM